MSKKDSQELPVHKKCITIKLCDLRDVILTLQTDWERLFLTHSNKFSLLFPKKAQ